VHRKISSELINGSICQSGLARCRSPRILINFFILRHSTFIFLFDAIALIRIYCFANSPLAAGRTGKRAFSR
jgi:hypothetical protein